jgi:hypothetical protein
MRRPCVVVQTFQTDIALLSIFLRTPYCLPPPLERLSQTLCSCPHVGVHDPCVVASTTEHTVPDFVLLPTLQSRKLCCCTLHTTHSTIQYSTVHTACFGQSPRSEFRLLEAVQTTSQALCVVALPTLIVIFSRCGPHFRVQIQGI